MRNLWDRLFAWEDRSVKGAPWPEVIVGAIVIFGVTWLMSAITGFRWMQLAVGLLAILTCRAVIGRRFDDEADHWLAKWINDLKALLWVLAFFGALVAPQV
jgi:hypothetical protein